MRLSLAFLLFCTIYVNAITFTHEFVNNDLLFGCRFELGGSYYDICPLILPNGHEAAGGDLLEYEWSRGVTGNRSYTFALGGMGRDRECPEGTWICMNKKRSDHHPQHKAKAHGLHYIPIAGKSRPDSVLVDQGINAFASLLDNDNYPGIAYLNIFFIGGFWEGVAQYALIDFICNHDAGPGAPSFKQERQGVHIFKWTTQHGCPVNDGFTAVGASRGQEPLVVV